MDEDGIDIDRAILRALLKGLKKPPSSLRLLFDNVIITCDYCLIKR